MPEKVFAFDVGTGSLGIAVRVGNKIVETHSLLIPEEFASIKEQRDRRRQWRTRQAHKAREKWLKQICTEAGIEALEGIQPEDKKRNIKAKPGDPRLEREFAGPGDNTVYTSCLLRIMLLRGEKLEAWQIYKALHSAIQRRGYDDNIPWKHREKSKKETDESENIESVTKYMKDLKEIVDDNADFMYPCYFDAFKMGLWNPKTDEIKKNLSPNKYPERARGNTPPRDFVEKEVRALLINAEKQFPSLKGKTDFILYGPAKKPYASHNPELRKQHDLKEGGETDWQGVLSQKIPRFDNRIVEHCSLIPRFHVCRASDMLVLQTTFLMKLINMRYKHEVECSLTPADINAIFSEKMRKATDLKKEMKSSKDSENQIFKKIASIFKFTPTQWENWIKKNKSGTPILNHSLIDPPKFTGRSRFSRPALRIMRDLILSGKSPHDYYTELCSTITNTDPQRGIVREDLSFLNRMPAEWERICIPQFTLAEKYFDETGDVDTAINKVINKQKDPVVRHRLGFFKQQLDRMEKQYGIPDRVMIEFVREDFMGEKKKREFIRIQNENRKKREAAAKQAEEIGLEGRDIRLKLQLLKQQNNVCVYTGDNLTPNDVNLYEIDHIVPRGGRYNGSDSFINKVITKSETNREKSDRTPFEYFSQTGGWDAFCELVNKNRSTLGHKKTALLTSPNPEELDEKYMSLAETAWIARTARDVVCLSYGWQPGEKGKQKRVFVIPGGLTGKVRGKYKIDSLLALDETESEKIMKKNRDDKRHHALDAMVISFMRENHVELPEGINRDFFRQYIDSVVPEQVAFQKPALEQTIYAKRNIYENGTITEKIVKRICVADIAFDNNKFSVKKARKNAQSIVDNNIRKQIESFLDNEPDRDGWMDFVKTLRQSPNSGSFVKKTAVIVGDPSEYKDLSKDIGRGQYRRAAKHQGQYVYKDEKNKYRVRPVYAFESKQNVRNELIQNGYDIHDFFTAGCLVEIQHDIDLGNRIIPNGKYILATLLTDRRAKLQSTLSVLNNPVGLEHLMKAGFRRVR